MSIAMSTVWFLVALVCLCCVKHTFSHTLRMENVAYSKQVTLSSKHPIFPGSRAVNGILTDFAHTDTEKSPWLRVDLDASYRIHEIEIFPRPGYGSQLNDFDVRVGDDIHNLHMCGHFTGIPTQRVAIWCPHNTVGRYVQVQIVSGSSSVLSMAEILVWGVPE